MAEIHCPKCRKHYNFSGDELRKLECSACHAVFTAKEAKEIMLAATKQAEREIMFSVCLVVFFIISTIIVLVCWHRAEEQKKCLRGNWRHEVIVEKGVAKCMGAAKDTYFILTRWGEGCERRPEAQKGLRIQHIPLIQKHVLQEMSVYVEDWINDFQKFYCYKNYSCCDYHQPQYSALVDLQNHIWTTNERFEKLKNDPKIKITADDRKLLLDLGEKLKDTIKKLEAKPD
jgi:ssDNA-binding Zn-finger/Zn-ribbon topoisomerase 1